MSNYRKFYEQHYGPIPKDNNGRTYDIHHIDGNHENDLPENLIAVSIQKHYDIHYSQGDWGACHRMSDRMQLSPEEISNLATLHNLKRVANGTHQFLGENNPSHQRVKDGTHNLLGGAVSRKSAQKRVNDGTHHLLKRSDGTSLSSDRVASGTHQFLGENNPSHQRVKDGTHNFVTNNPGKGNGGANKGKKIGAQEIVKCPYCPIEGGIGAMKRYHFNNCKNSPD